MKVLGNAAMAAMVKEAQHAEDVAAKKAARLQRVYVDGEMMSRAEVARRYKISTTTVSNIIKRLGTHHLKAEQVVKVNPGPPAGSYLGENRKERERREERLSSIPGPSEWELRHLGDTGGGVI